MTAHPRRRRDDGAGTIVRQYLIPALALIVAAFALILSAGDNRHAEEVATRAAARVRVLEVRDRDTSRRAAYRLCARNRADRAFAHASVERREGPKALIRLEDPTRIPILDCGANLRGGGARLMSPAQQRRFVERWIRGEIPLRQLGICPESGVQHRPGESIAGC